MRSQEIHNNLIPNQVLKESTIVIILYIKYLKLKIKNKFCTTKFD